MFTTLLILAGLALFMRMQAIPKDFDFPDTASGLDAIPVDARGLYLKQDDGTVVIDPEVKKRFDHTPLAQSLDKERKAKKDLERTIAGFKALGLGDTPEEAMAAIKAELEELDPEDEDDKGKIKNLKAMREKLKAEFDETLKKEVGASNAKLEKMQRSLQKNMLEKEAINALAKHKGSTDLLLPHVMSKLGLIEDDNGDFVVRVLDADGDPVSDGRGGYKSVEMLVTEMKADEKFARGFEASGKSGSGMKQFERVRTGGNPDGNKSTIGKIGAGLARLRR